MSRGVGPNDSAVPLPSSPSAAWQGWLGLGAVGVWRLVRTFLQLCVLFGTAKGVLVALCVRDGNQHLLATPFAVIALLGADVKVALLVADARGRELAQCCRQLGQLAQ
jgi:hypothetical protein